MRWEKFILPVQTKYFSAEQHRTAQSRTPLGRTAEKRTAQSLSVQIMTVHRVTALYYYGSKLLQAVKLKIIVLLISIQKLKCVFYSYANV